MSSKILGIIQNGAFMILRGPEEDDSLKNLESKIL
jgi:hypothetical protein